MEEEKRETDEEEERERERPRRSTEKKFFLRERERGIRRRRREAGVRPSTSLAKESDEDLPPQPFILLDGVALRPQEVFFRSLSTAPTNARQRDWCPAYPLILHMQVRSPVQALCRPGYACIQVAFCMCTRVSLSEENDAWRERGMDRNVFPLLVSPSVLEELNQPRKRDLCDDTQVLRQRGRRRRLTFPILLVALL